MKHSYRLKGESEVRELDCELGSRVFDVNGVEIIEGDLVKFLEDGMRTFAGTIVPILYLDGGFFAGEHGEPIDGLYGRILEIVGRVED